MAYDPYAISEPEDIKLDALRYLQMIYRDPALSTAVRMRAAAFAIPFETPKLLATAVINEQSFAELLDRRLKKVAEMKSIEPINSEPVVSEPIIQPEPTPSPPLPAPLNRLYSSRFRRI